MAFHRIAAFSLGLIATQAQAAAPYWISWRTDFIPCTGYMGSAIQGSGLTNACMAQNSTTGQMTALSICPHVDHNGPNEPYNQEQIIAITDAQLSVASNDPDAILKIEIGSAFSQPEGDVFALCAGRGAASCDHLLLTPLLQGGKMSTSPPHMDVYGYCISSKPGATVEFTVLLGYTVAPTP